MSNMSRKSPAKSAKLFNLKEFAKNYSEKMEHPNHSGLTAYSINKVPSKTNRLKPFTVTCNIAIAA